jgi:two-component system, cell cycle sensor histidine kinase and response regulator CckA
MDPSEGGQIPPRLLLVEEDPETAAVALDWIRGDPGSHVGAQASVHRSASLQEARSELVEGGVEVEAVLLALPPHGPIPTDWVQEISGGPPFLPVLVLARNATPDQDMAAHRAGASGYLGVTEHSAADLERALRYALRDARIRREEWGRREHLQALVENISETMILTSADGTIRYASPPVEALFGDGASALLGRSAFDFIHPDDRELARRDFGEVAADVELPGPSEFRILRADGTTRVVAASGRNLLRNPSVEGIVVTLRDISDRALLEERLRHSQKMEAVGRLAGGIAHDFNNILTVLRGHTELLLEDIPPQDPLRGDLEEIRKGTDRAAVLTSRLLAFSRRQVLLLQEVVLAEVVQGMEEMLRRFLGSHVELEVDARHRGRVRADPSQMEQVILNLAVNARDAMPRGGSLSFKVEAGEITPREAARKSHFVRPGSYVRLTVTDTGEGMDAATRARIFEPFFTTKAVGVGTGLGLAMAYGVVKQSHGYIWVESAPGEGTTFRIYLPRLEFPATTDSGDSPR